MRQLKVDSAPSAKGEGRRQACIEEAGWGLELAAKGKAHTSYLSLFLHNHNLRPENFTLESA